MATKKSFVPGDLVLVRFSGYGYWPAKIIAQKVTADYRKGGRKIMCFGKYEKGFAYTPDMKHYEDSAKMKFISKSSLKKYPALAKALEQISLEFRNRRSADISEIVSLPGKGKMKLAKFKESIQEIEANPESNEEEPNDGMEEANLDSNYGNAGPMNEESFNSTHQYHTVPFTEMFETNDDMEESNLDSNDGNAGPINEESFNSSHQYHTVPYTDMSETNEGMEEANLDSNDGNVGPIDTEPFSSTHKYHTVPVTDMGESISQPTKRFRLASKARANASKKEDPSHPFQLDTFNYEVKVEYDGDPERMQGNEQHLSSNRPNEECTNRNCTGRSLVEDTVKIKVEIEMSEDSFARVAHVLPSSFALNLTQASKKPPMANKLF